MLLIVTSISPLLTPNKDQTIKIKWMENFIGEIKNNFLKDQNTPNPKNQWETFLGAHRLRMVPLTVNPSPRGLPLAWKQRKRFGKTRCS